MKTITTTIVRAFESLMFLPFKSVLPEMRPVDRSAYTAPVVLCYEVEK